MSMLFPHDQASAYPHICITVGVRRAMWLNLKMPVRDSDCDLSTTVPYSSASYCLSLLLFNDGIRVWGEKDTNPVYHNHNCELRFSASSILTHSSVSNIRLGNLSTFSAQCFLSASSSLPLLPSIWPPLDVCSLKGRNTALLLPASLCLTTRLH